MTVHASIVPDKKGSYAVVTVQEVRCAHFLPNSRLCDKWLIAENGTMRRVEAKDSWDVRVLCPRCKNYSYYKKE